MNNDEPDTRDSTSISSHGDVNIAGSVVGGDQINNTYNITNIIQQTNENKLRPRDPFPQDEYTIIDATSIFGFSIEDIEHYLGEAIILPKRGIGDADELPDGGETRIYKRGPYMISVNFDKIGKAKGLIIQEGLLEQAFPLERWDLFLPKLGMRVLVHPDISDSTKHIWKNSGGYGIQVYSAGNRSSNIQIVRVFKLPT